MPLLCDDDQKFGMTHRENLDYWLLSIHGAAPSTPIQVVCTKSHLVSEGVCKKQMDALEDHFCEKAVASQIEDEIICTSSKSDKGIEKLRTRLQDCSKLKRCDQKHHKLELANYRLRRFITNISKYLNWVIDYVIKGRN